MLRDDGPDGAGPRPAAAGRALGSPVERGTPLRLTDTGARVLAGDADHVTLNGIDRWIGGVHLTGADVPWRWDEGTETVIGRHGR